MIWYERSKMAIIKLMTSENASDVSCFGCGVLIPPSEIATVVYPRDRAANGLSINENALLCPTCAGAGQWDTDSYRYARMYGRPAPCERCGRKVRAPVSGNRKAATACSRRCAVALNVARHARKRTA